MRQKAILANKNGARRKVLIIGAGLAILTAARMLALRDFDVLVVEKNSCPGGQFYLASVPPNKEKLGWANSDLLRDAKSAGAKNNFQSS